MRRLSLILVAIMVVCLLGLLTQLMMLRDQPSTASMILFISNRSGSDEIYQMLPDGSHVQQITYGVAQDLDIWYFAPSPDGQWIVLVMGTNRLEVSAIYRMRRDGSGIYPLTDNSIPYFDPSWSSDSKWILFAKDDQLGGIGIYKMHLDGSQIEQITDCCINFEPSWSPNGEWILFASSRDHVNLGIFRMRPDGSEIERLDYDSQNYYDPAWSPDGNWIVFKQGNPVEGDIYKIRWDGSGLQKLSQDDTSNRTPSWSPDGKWIAFTSGYDEIYLVSANGGLNRNLTQHPAEDKRPKWSPLIDLPYNPLRLGMMALGVLLGVGVLWRR